MPRCALFVGFVVELGIWLRDLVVVLLSGFLVTVLVV